MSSPLTNYHNDTTNSEWYLQFSSSQVIVDVVPDVLNGKQWVAGIQRKVSWEVSKSGGIGLDWQRLYLSGDERLEKKGPQYGSGTVDETRQLWDRIVIITNSYIPYLPLFEWFGQRKAYLMSYYIEKKAFLKPNPWIFFGKQKKRLSLNLLIDINITTYIKTSYLMVKFYI